MPRLSKEFIGYLLMDTILKDSWVILASQDFSEWGLQSVTAERKLFLDTTDKPMQIVALIDKRVPWDAAKNIYEIMQEMLERHV